MMMISGVLELLLPTWAWDSSKNAATGDSDVMEAAAVPDTTERALIVAAAMVTSLHMSRHLLWQPGQDHSLTQSRARTLSLLRMRSRSPMAGGALPAL